MKNRLLTKIGLALICVLAMGVGAPQARAATPQSTTPQPMGQQVMTLAKAQQLMAAGELDPDVAYPGDAPDGAGAAKQQPAPRELLNECDKDNCVFHPSGPPKNFLGKKERVSGVYNNCPNNVQGTYSLAYSQTTGESNSFGVSLSAEYGFSMVFKVSFEVSYEHTWETSKTVTRRADITVPGHHKAYWVRAAPMHKMKGIYEIHFDEKFYGHYIWYLPFHAKGPNENGGKEVLQPHVVKCKKA